MSRVTRRPPPRSLSLLVTGGASPEPGNREGAGGRGAVLLGSGEERVRQGHPAARPTGRFSRVPLPKPKFGLLLLRQFLLYVYKYFSWGGGWGFHSSEWGHGGIFLFSFFFFLFLLLF